MADRAPVCRRVRARVPRGRWAARVARSRGRAARRAALPRRAGPGPRRRARPPPGRRARGRPTGRAPRGGRARPAARRRVLGRGDDMAPHGAPAGCPGGDRARVGAGRGVRRAAGTRHGAPVSGDRRVGVVRAGCGMRPAARAGGRRAGDRGRRPRRACPRSGPGWPNWRRSPGWGRAPRTNRC